MPHVPHLGPVYGRCKGRLHAPHFIQRIQLSSWQFINSSLGQLTGYFQLFYVQLKWQIVATAYALHPTLRSVADNGSKAKPNPLWINWQCFSASGHVRGTPLTACVCVKAFCITCNVPPNSGGLAAASHAHLQQVQSVVERFMRFASAVTSALTSDAYFGKCVYVWVCVQPGHTIRLKAMWHVASGKCGWAIVWFVRRELAKRAGLMDSCSLWENRA